jgi:Ran GTPase-activating protein (RanGAP) involved in mRNA processing and transport
MLFLPDNKSLLTLNLSRKNLNDTHGIQIAEMLKKNKKLRRLELEGNFFGPETAKALAEALRVNRTLRYLDLENNNLTNAGEDDSGIHAMLESLRVNTILISLNLSNNYLTGPCGNSINDCLRGNKTLIHLEISQNQKFISKLKDREENDSKFVSCGLGINQIKEVKDKLAENRILYENARKEEWKERKNMTSEADDMISYINISSQRQLEENIKKDEKKYIENFYLDCFEKEVATLETAFVNNVDQFYIETKTRLEKKNKKKKPAKKRG